MCGRFALTAKTGEIEHLIPEKRVSGNITPRYNIAPSQKIAAILNTKADELAYINWGLIPYWAKEDGAKYASINAKAETLSEKASFKVPFRKRRCLIPVSGFYEWQTVPKESKKQPHFIRLISGEVFTFAGLWDEWASPEGSKIITAAIITTEANELMSPIHNRMPVIIPEDKRNIWLDQSSDTVILNALLKPFPSTEMIAFPVSTRVNSPSFDDDSLIIPL